MGQRNLVQGLRGIFERARRQQPLPRRLMFVFILRIMDGLAYTLKPKDSYKSLKLRPKITKPYGISSSIYLRLTLKCAWT
jgi:hypothetical protein